jgi:hypothetical protein
MKNIRMLATLLLVFFTLMTLCLSAIIIVYIGELQADARLLMGGW